jgi:hypothetical protein
MAGAAGIFAQAQPEYAAHGVATFPVNVSDAGKVPAVRGFQRVGLAASRILSERFPHANALAFMAGSRSKLTILDIDSRDERELAGALDRHGASPLVIGTAHGFHAYYRHNGEARRIRPDRALPVDVLGGGPVVAAPSQIGTGTGYRIIQGSLDDLDRLPTLRYTCGNTDAAGTGWKSLRRGDGRNDDLYRHLMRAALSSPNADALAAEAIERAKGYADPIEPEEALRTAASAWRATAEGRNRFGRHGAFVAPEEAADLIAAPCALAMLTYLRANNAPGRTFLVANGLLDAGSFKSWSRRDFKSARQTLIERGMIVPTSRPKPGVAVSYRFGSPGARRLATP